MGARSSHIVHEFNRLSPEEKTEAIEYVLEKDVEIKRYLESKYSQSSLIRPVEASRPLTSKPGKRRLVITEPVPTEQQTHTEELHRWNENVYSFWISESHSLFPEGTAVDPILFILTSTVSFKSKSHADGLRGRFLAIFWYDYFEETYPNQKSGFGAEYTKLAKGVKVNVATGEKEGKIVEMLRGLVKAGRRYALLAKKFGDGILLTLPTSIGRTTLEDKLPLDQKEFDDWSAPIQDSKWLIQAKTAESTARKIRDSLMKECRQWDRSHRPAKRRRMGIDSAQCEPSSTTVAAEQRQVLLADQLPFHQDELDAASRLHNAPFESLAVDQPRLGKSLQDTNAFRDVAVETESAHHIEEDQQAGDLTCNPNSLSILLTAAQQSDAEAGSLSEGEISSSAFMPAELASTPFVATGQLPLSPHVNQDKPADSTTGSTAEGKGTESLAQKDSSLQTSASIFDADHSWDARSWPESPPLFDADCYFDMFRTAEILNEDHVLMV